MSQPLNRRLVTEASTSLTSKYTKPTGGIPASDLAALPTIDGGTASASGTAILVRRDTAANWATTNPILSSSEQGLEKDTNKRKTGNGTSTWSALAYDTDAISTTITANKNRATAYSIVLGG